MPSIYALAGALMLAATAFGQKGEIGPNNDTTPHFLEDEIVVHVVTVGYFPDAFQPNSINVNPGDKVMFKFYPGGHSVIESLYGWPCVPRGSVTGQDGFFSGAFPNTTTEDPAIWNLTVTHTGPIFYYCGLAGSCINYGMIGVINPTAETNLTGMIDLAKQSRFYLEPNATLTPAAAASISALASTILATSTADSSSSSLSTGAIAGIAIGGVVALALIAGFIIFFIRRRKTKAAQNTIVPQQSAGSQTGPKPPMNAPGEMALDGMAYAPAYHPDNKTAFLPPYYPPQQESRSLSPETIHNYPTPMAYPGQQSQYSPVPYSSRRSPDDSESAFYAPRPMHPPQPMHSPQPQPLPRHELDAQPSEMPAGESIVEHERETTTTVDRSVNNAGNNSRANS